MFNDLFECSMTFSICPWHFSDFPWLFRIPHDFFFVFRFVFDFVWNFHDLFECPMTVSMFLRICPWFSEYPWLFRISHDLFRIPHESSAQPQKAISGVSRGPQLSTKTQREKWCRIDSVFMVCFWILGFLRFWGIWGFVGLLGSVGICFCFEFLELMSIRSRMNTPNSAIRIIPRSSSKELRTVRYQVKKCLIKKREGLGKSNFLEKSICCWFAPEWCLYFFISFLNESWNNFQ